MQNYKCGATDENNKVVGKYCGKLKMKTTEHVSWDRRQILPITLITIDFILFSLKKLL